MPKVRKKQIEVEAFLWDVDDPPTRFQDAFSSGEVELRGSRALIETLEGNMSADKGDWVIRSDQGELYPCKPVSGR